MAALLLATLVVGCGAGRSTGAAAPNLTVFAAASLRTAMDGIAGGYLASTGVAITVATDSSAALATQIEQGAPADVFLSADTRNPARLAEAGLVDGAPIEFARNALAIVVPAGEGGLVDDPFDLGRSGVGVIAAGPAVPITGYARELVAALARSPGAPSGLEAAYEGNIVSREDNVAAVVAKIALGEGDAAIVYATDALVDDAALVSVELPAGVDVAASYAGVALATAADPGQARHFLAWLVGPEGQALLRDAGFRAPATSR